nr:unnamed protein product [Naegleria fowleri]
MAEQSSCPESHHNYSSPVEDSKSCNCFFSWSKANHRMYLRNELKKAFGGDEHVPFQMVSQDKSVVTVCHVGKMLTKIILNHSPFSLSDSKISCSISTSEQLQMQQHTSFGKYQNIINELRTCWRKKHQHRPFKHVISWITNFIQMHHTKEAMLPIYSLFHNEETPQLRVPKNSLILPNSNKIRIFIGFSKEDVLKHVRNIVLIALHSLLSSQTHTIHLLLVEEKWMYWIKLEFKKSLKKALVNLIKYDLNQLEHLCALFVELWKLMDSVKPAEVDSEDCPRFEQFSHLCSERNAVGDTTCENHKSKARTLTKNKQQLLKRTRDILQTIPLLQLYSCGSNGNVQKTSPHEMECISSRVEERFVE